MNSNLQMMFASFKFFYVGDNVVLNITINMFNYVSFVFVK